MHSVTTCAKSTAQQFFKAYHVQVYQPDLNMSGDIKGLPEHRTAFSTNLWALLHVVV